MRTRRFGSPSEDLATFDVTKSLKAKLVAAMLFLGASATSLAQSDQASGFPVLHNSSDTECEPHRQCTDEEFQQLVAAEKAKWAKTPKPIRDLCTASQTLPRLYDCVLGASVQWANLHPGQPMDWQQ